MYVYDLTPLTRKVNTDRRVIVQGFDLPRRGSIVFLLGLPLALMAVAPFWRLLNVWALLIGAAVMLAWFWLIESRTRDGLQLRQYQAIFDKKFAALDVFVRCWAPIDDEADSICHIRTSAVPLREQGSVDTITEEIYRA